MKYKNIVLCFLSSFLCVHGDENNKKTSEALGHLIGKNFQAFETSLDWEALVKGLKEELSGTGASFTEQECIEALDHLEKKQHCAKGKRNLQEAEEFLAKNKNKESVVSLAENKVQFEVLKKGKGEIVQGYHAPLVRCKGMFLHGQTFTADETEVVFELEEILPGLRQAIVGMAEGEARKVYIHPSLGYGSDDPMEPNALLIFEVEVLQADVSSEQMVLPEAAV